MDGLQPGVAEMVEASKMRIVVTGAGGWIGLATLELLKSALGDAFAGRVCAFGSSNRDLRLRDGTTIAQRPLSALADLPPVPTIVLHLAFLTKDLAEAMTKSDYRAANRAIDDRVLGALDRIDARAIFVASSGAAASTNPAPAMQRYGSLKREQEQRFADWAGHIGKRAVISRLFNLSGPYINKQSSYALAAFIRDALDGGPIVIRAPHRVIRSYVAIRELMSLVFALLLDGSAKITRFDSGGEPIEMQAIAEAVAAQVGNVTISRPPLDPTASDDYVGDAAGYAALLHTHRIAPVTFVQQVAETIDYLSFFQENESRHRLANHRPA